MRLHLIKCLSFFIKYDICSLCAPVVLNNDKKQAKLFQPHLNIFYKSKQFLTFVT